MFTIFCSHVTKTSLFSRLYVQWAVNQVLTMCLIDSMLRWAISNSDT